MLRKIRQVTLARPAMDGEGVALQRNALFDGRLDPFLMLDELKASPQDDVGAFPVHPHRGIQTLSYLIDGGMAHKDSMGNASEVLSGGLQWMHTGQGIEHAEIPKVDANGLWGFQFWLNVPREEKYQAPQYQDMDASHLPWHSLDDLAFKVVAGNWRFNGQEYGSDFQKLSGNGALADLKWQGQSKLSVAANEASLALYVIGGKVVVNGDSEIAAGQLVQFASVDSEDGEISLSGDATSRALLFKGEPIGEPIVHRGPFVMTSNQEIEETLQAYRDGTLVKS